MIQLVECPRDAMQGIEQFIPTELKISYINQLLRVGFHTLDFGSFVSEKAIPQLRDTAEVLQSLDLENRTSRLLCIVANLRGAERAIEFREIDDIGFPFSISETFQRRNTNTSIEESLTTVREIQKLCTSSGKRLVLYISMGFGNPYGDPWSAGLCIDWCKRLSEEIGVEVMALSDTIGVSNPDNISGIFDALIPAMKGVTIGAHLHTTPEKWEEKVHAAYQSGCRRFDGAIKGFGGCPMAADQLTGNMPMEKMVQYFDRIRETMSLDLAEFTLAQAMALEIFPAIH
jgi:hydroxymethylglutaryl-CoA lyase